MGEIMTNRQLEIIEAAGKILTHGGVSGLTTKNLAKEMNFSEAAIYRHFDSKEKIIISMLKFVASEMDERYSILLCNTDSPEDRFRRIFMNLFSFFTKNPHYVVAVFSDGLMEESHLINEAIFKIMAVKIKHLRPIIEDGQKTGVFIDTVTSDGLVHMVMGSIRLQMYKWRVADFQFDNVKEGNIIINALLKLIKK